MCVMHEFFRRRPDGTWDSVAAERVQREMDQFEEAFNAQQNALPPSERATEEIRKYNNGGPICRGPRWDIDLILASLLAVLARPVLPLNLKQLSILKRWNVDSKLRMMERRISAPISPQCNEVPASS
ncbi:hypothetical protein A2U01_0031860 [Trifolium medium]|uniref:Uncharacterized protein n=1 Tax=Trifolium medium TaxID=97028 RepID=A0A392PIP6_9FABA|nr:hypothetical protein [Trifolium medium]